MAGFIRKAVRVAKVVTNTDISTAKTECLGCGKEVKARKSNFCSKACAQFYSHHRFG